MKTTRRGFLRQSSTAMTIPFAAAGAIAHASPTAPDAAHENMGGQVPATLDLAERGQVTVNGLAGTLDRGNVPEFYFKVKLVPPTFIHDAISFAACGPKYWEAFVMLRAMTGGGHFQDVEDSYRQYMLSCTGEDGLFYCKIGPERPWDKSSPEDYANIYGQGRMIRALLAQYDLDGNPDWMKRARKIGNRLGEIAISKDDYIYYPTSPGYGDMFSYPKSGYKATDLLRDPHPTTPGLPNDTFGIPMYLGGTILPLVRLAEKAQDERMMELAQKLTRFLMLPQSGWVPTEYARGVAPAIHGQYRGHFHGHVMALRGILSYGVAANNNVMKQFARDGYEFSRTLGIAPLGWFEETAGKHSHETCCLADMISLAIRLSEAGVGDYWDDVDGYVRNHLTEGQFLDLQKMKQINQDLTPEQEGLLERSIGTYCGWGTPTSLSTVLQNCCMANGAQGLYSAWESIVKFESETAKVNLLLNRTSPWLDVESYLPFQGKVVLRNKRARRIFVRVPGWVEKSKLDCRVDGHPVTPRFLGNYLLLDPVGNSAVVTLAFPIYEETQQFTLEDYGNRGTEPRSLATYKYRVSLRAGTATLVTSIEGDKNLTYEGGKKDVSAVYPAYQDRGYLTGTVAPLKKRGLTSTAKIIRSW